MSATKTERERDFFYLASLTLLSLFLIIFRWHLVEQDFIEILNSADGFYRNLGYCFLEINKTLGNHVFQGLTGRPPLISILLSISFKLIGHNLLAIALIYAIPRLFILAFTYLLARQFVPPILSFLTASILLFSPYFDTYAISTLKADVFVVFFSLAATSFAVYWQKTNKNICLFLSSVFIALNLLSKETASSFSATLFTILLITTFLKSKNRTKNLTLLFSPILILVFPFIIFSVLKTGKITTNIYADTYEISQFYNNSKTHILSALYYTGINFSLNKIVSIWSLVKLILIITGLLAIVKKRLLTLFLPVTAFLAGIAIHPADVVQGQVVGNREMLHRIALIVPFMYIYITFGVTTIFAKLKNLQSVQSLPLLTLFVINIVSIFYYFRAPYALDYSQNEYYINLSTILAKRITIPVSTFSLSSENLCITNDDSGAESFLLNEYRSDRVSAFPPYFKEIVVTTWFIMLCIGYFICRPKFKS